MQNRRSKPVRRCALSSALIPVVLWVLSTAFTPTFARAKDEVISISHVPEVVLAAALRAVPGLVIDEIEREGDDAGGWHYELEGLADGVGVEVEVTPEGRVVDIERDEMEPRSDTPRADVKTVTPRSGSSRAPAELGKSPSPISEIEVLRLATREAEIVAVAGSGENLRAWVVSPETSCGGRGEHSKLSFLEWSAPSKTPSETVVDLGPGEATSVAALPDGSGAVVVVKDSMSPNTAAGRALLVRDGVVSGRIPVGPGPDSVAVSPDGTLFVVACEATAPDREECPAEDGNEDLPGSIEVLELRGTRDMAVIATIEGRQLFDRLRGETNRASHPRDVEPEFVSVTPDSSLALVTLQEQSAVAVIDLELVRELADRGLERRAIGSSALRELVLLPHDDRGTSSFLGARPDGIAISPDGSFAVTANEAHPKSRSLQGISILDLRDAPATVRLVSSHSVFDLDPTLRDAIVGSDREERPLRLPRLDPEGVVIFPHGDRTLAAISIERSAPGEAAGSALFLDVTAAETGRAPVRVSRQVVGAHTGARPEGIVSTSDGRLVLIACERDGGTLTRIALHADPSGSESDPSRAESARTKLGAPGFGTR